MRSMAIRLGLLLLLAMPVCAWAQTNCTNTNNKNCTQAKPAPPPPAPAPRPSPPPEPAPRPNNNPPPSQPAAPRPANTNTPAPSQPAPARPGYTPPPSGGNPQPANRPTNQPSNGTAYTPHTYTPGSTGTTTGTTTGNNSGPAPRPANQPAAGTTYTPRTYTPGKAAPAGENSAAPKTSSSGTTTYTPHAANSAPANRPAPSTGNPSSVGVAGPNGAVTYTPNASHPVEPAKISSATGIAESPHPAYKLPPSATGSGTANGSSVLTASGSASVLHDVNSARSNLKGINKSPIPAGVVTTHGDGSLTVKSADGRQYGLRPNGTIASYTSQGKTVAFRGNGQIRSIHTPTMDITHNSLGQRTVIMRRPDNSVLVSTGPRSGYVQRTITQNGRPLVLRTYVSGVTSHTQVFTTYSYHGMVLNEYVPGFYYPADFYGWAYYPWLAPVPFAWGWAGEPWYAYYGPYFAASQAYANAAQWLTDYYLSQTLADGYQDTQAAAQDDGPDPADANSAPVNDAPAPNDEAVAQTDTPITPELKQAIADEVQQQLSYENAASADPAQAPTLDGLPQVLIPNHYFVASTPLNVVTSDSLTCGISAGDVLQLAAPPPDNAVSGDVTVITTHQGDCPAGAQLSLSLMDLQDMQNNFRAKLDMGLSALHNSQGQGGLPAAPQSAIGPPPRPAANVPADKSDVQAQIRAARVQAKTTETQATEGIFSQHPAGKVE
jgi:hypothetical protein